MGTCNQAHARSCVFIHDITKRFTPELSAACREGKGTEAEESCLHRSGSEPILQTQHVRARTLFSSYMANPLRGEVFKLYRSLLYLGREYPKGAVYFRDRLKSAFMKNKDVTDPEQIKKLVARGDFVIKELEALYFLRKYRTMKKRYYEPDK